MDGLVDELVEGAREEMARSWPSSGGAVEAVPYMKTQLVESHRERMRRIEAGELKVVGPERLHGGRAVAAPGGRGRRHPARRPGGRAVARSTPCARGASGRDERPRSTPRWTRCARPPRTRTRTSCRRRSRPPARARRPASGPARCARCSASTARRPAWATPRPRASDDALRALRDRVERGVRGARPADQDPGRQAGPRRPLERRRADRRARPRRRHGRGLRGHPAHAGRASPARRSTRACTWSGCRSCPAPTPS